MWGQHPLLHLSNMMMHLRRFVGWNQLTFSILGFIMMVGWEFEGWWESAGCDVFFYHHLCRIFYAQIDYHAHIFGTSPAWASSARTCFAAQGLQGWLSSEGWANIAELPHCTCAFYSSPSAVTLCQHFFHGIICAVVLWVTNVQYR